MRSKPIALRSPGGYVAALEKGHVRADFEARRARIRAGAMAAAEAEGGEAVIDPAVLDEVTALTEWPVPLVGAFEPRFLELPAEVLIATMQDHQRYFPVRAEGRQADAALHRGREPRKPGSAAGARRQRARRAAAPRRRRLLLRRRPQGDPAIATRRRSAPSLSRPSSAATPTRPPAITALAGQIARVAGHDPATAQRAAEISKCDLLTAMVGEFPELQGVMGRYYARHDGESAGGRSRHRGAVPAPLRRRCPAHDRRRARARHGRQARHPGRHLRDRPEADRAPRIPFGLRRAALGVLRILIEPGIALDLRELIRSAIDSVARRPRPPRRQGAGGQPGRGHLRLHDGAAARLVPRARRRRHDRDVRRRARHAPGLAARLRRSPARALRVPARSPTRPGSPPPTSASRTSSRRRASSRARASIPASSPTRTSASLRPRSSRSARTSSGSSPRGAMRMRLRGSRPCAVRSTRSSNTCMVMADDVRVRANRLALLAALQRLFLHIANLSRLPG